MPRENSLSDSERRSLTPDLEEEQEREAAFELAAARPSMSSAASPAYTSIPQNGHFAQGSTSPIATAPTQSPPPRTSGVTSPTNGFKRSSEQWNRPSITITPKDRFRTAVRKVISMHRGMTFMSVGMGRGRDTERIGAEPGVDPRRASADMQYGHIHRKCAIEIMDYSSLRTTVKMMNNEEFVEMLQDEVRSHRPSWVRVRWINIGGLSWDVIKAMSFRYDLHPLALEDIFHGHGQTRSKADYYPRHLFLRVLCHQLSENDMDDENVFIPTLRSSSPEPYDKDEDMTLHESPDPQPRRKRRRHILPFHHHDVARGANHLFHLIQKENRRRDAQMITLNALKRGERVDVEVSPMFIFLFRDGTVISIHSKPNLNFTAPITHRLRQTDTVLRQSPDPSILVHALLDIIVDRALQVVDAYHDKINKFEQDILIKPKAKTIRRLHILSGDLILHKRTLEPVKTLVYGLRRYDVDRCAALIDTSDPANAHVPVVGFMSHKSKIYLADVFDHMEYILTSLDMFASIAENLINYSFNSASYEMNVVMRRLTLVTIIGLPLTLLTGYFGMNFNVMWSVQSNSDLFFWKLAIPIAIVTAILALWQDLTQMYHYTSKKVFAKRAVQMV
ncbi:Magnesium transport protein CorA [Leucoagaricus sp. SymC.cos]|nr:Magnesium transport protein CorA [Leucoagaricus sp. SymC.cos]